MKNQEVKVNVVGLSGSGKSCVIFEIYKALKTAGFEVELDVEGQFDYENEVDFMKQMLVNEKKRIENVKKKSKISLKEVQAVKNLADYGK